MVEVSATIPAARERVFDVLADGWIYAGWVVGASHIRQVDSNWPQLGSRIHHSSGPWPLQVQDITVVRAVDPPRMIELEARLWPLGTARVRLDLDDYGPNVTQVRMTEHAQRGPARLVPHAMQALLLVPRNRESLRRLADLAVRRQGGNEHSADDHSADDHSADDHSADDHSADHHSGVSGADSGAPRDQRAQR